MLFGENLVNAIAFQAEDVNYARPHVFVPMPMWIIPRMSPNPAIQLIWIVVFRCVLTGPEDRVA